MGRDEQRGSLENRELSEERSVEAIDRGSRGEQAIDFLAADAAARARASAELADKAEDRVRVAAGERVEDELPRCG